MTEFLTAAGLILTTLLAFMQIQKTHRSTIAAQEAHLRDELKVRLYEKSAPVFQDAAFAVSATLSDHRTTLGVLDMQAKGYPVAHIKSSSDLLDIQRGASRAVIAVMLFLEQHEIAFTRFRGIRRELDSAQKALIDSHNQLWMKLVLFIPPPRAYGALPHAPVAATPESIRPAQDFFPAFEAACSDIQCYLLDLQIEAQNELLGSLFQRQLPPRNPEDKSQKVLTRDSTEVSTRPPGSLI